MRGRKKSDATRRAIVQCAAQIFAQRAFHEVLTDDIAHRLGIGKGTIYRYFKSKDALYLAAIGAGLDGLHTAITAVLQQDTSPTATIEAVVQTMISHFWRQRDFLILFHRLEPKLQARERADWRKRRDEVVRMVRGVLERAAHTRTIAPVNTRLAVELLFGMIRAACLYRADGDRPEELTRMVTDIFLHGITGKRRARTERRGALRAVRPGTVIYP